MKQSDTFGSHIFIEIITRAISKLDLLVYPKSASNQTGPDSFHGVLKAWMDPGNLVDVLEIEDPNSHDVEESCKVFRNGKFDKLLKPEESYVEYEEVRREIMRTVSQFDSKVFQ